MIYIIAFVIIISIATAVIVVLRDRKTKYSGYFLIKIKGRLLWITFLAKYDIII